jgi:predicted nucleic acid-binding protein
MKDVLLDTNVISEAVKPKPDVRVIAFLRAAVDPWISSITLHELAYGAERAPDPMRRAKLLAWIAGISTEFAERTIIIDGAVADRSGRLRALAAVQGKAVTVSDALIAACAELRGLQVATRNTSDFAPLGVRVVDPWTHKGY